MNKFVNFLIGQTINFIDEENKMNEEFKKRAESSRVKYWDACKYPRKKKKQIRKEALLDYSFYMAMSKPVLGNF
jgi:hypothetical protein